MAVTSFFAHLRYIKRGWGPTTFKFHDLWDYATLLAFPTKESLLRVKEKVKKITGRTTGALSLGEILGQLNPVLRGWSNYYRYDAAKSTFSYLDYYT